MVIVEVLMARPRPRSGKVPPPGGIKLVSSALDSIFSIFYLDTYILCSLGL